MLSQPGFRTRTPKKQNQLVQRLRAKMISGEWAAGAQLPIRTELEGEFDVSSTTLQRALDQLRDEGFVFARGSSGTFVSATPPHTHHYGLVFPKPRFPFTDQFWSSLEAAAAMMEEQRPELKIPVFTNGIASPEHPETAELLQTVEEGRLAGLIFGSTYPAYAHHAALVQTPLPKVSLCSGKLAVPSVWFDYECWLARALEMLIAKGRRRIAVLAYSAQANAPEFLQYWLGLLKASRAIGGEHWWVGLPMDQPVTTQCLIKLLMRGSASERPDGLIVLNGNFTETVIGTLMQLGISIPGEVELVAHCNFPSADLGAIPITRLGFSIPQLLHTCVDLLEQQVAGKAIEKRSLIEPLTESEYLAQSSSAPLTLA